MKRFLTLILVCALLVLCLSGCSLFKKPAPPEPVPEDTQAEQIDRIRQLADRCRIACNEMDVDGILDCITPSVATPLRSMLKLAGGLSGDGEAQVMELLCSALGADSSDYQQVCRSLTAELSDIEVDGDKATANLTYRYEIDGQAYEGKADLTCEQSDGRWLISKLQGK